MTKIFLDAGHGGHDPGAVGNGFREKDLNLEIVLEMEKILLDEYEGVQVGLSRKTDVFLTLAQRTDLARKFGAKAFVSVHFNAFNGKARGTETFKHRDSKASIPLQEAVQKQLVALLKAPNRGTKDAGYAVLTGTFRHMYSILTEVLFIDNKEDMDIYKRIGAKAVALAHVEGLAQALKLKKKPVVKPTPVVKPIPVAKPSGTMFRVVTGSFSTREGAEKRIADLKKAGFDSFIDVK